MDPTNETRETLWKQYEMWIALYRDYMHIVLRLNVFFYAITGAIVAYHFANLTNPWARLGLLFPALMSGMFSYGFFQAIPLIAPMRQDVFDIRDALGLRVAPDVGVLAEVLKVFGRLLALVSIGLSLLAISPLFRPVCRMMMEAAAESPPIPSSAAPQSPPPGAPQRQLESN